jgi:hypothetical protein
MRTRCAACARAEADTLTFHAILTLPLFCHNERVAPADAALEVPGFVLVVALPHSFAATMIALSPARAQTRCPERCQRG